MTERTELIQGPVPRWEVTAEDKKLIMELLESDDELDRAYGEVYSNGLFVKEFTGVAAVGEMEKIAILAFRLGKSVDEIIDGLQFGDLMSLGTYPGRGDSRSEMVRDSMQKALEARHKQEDPEALDLYGSFVESGYKVEAFLPRNSSQPTEWTVKIFNEGEDEPFRVETIPMSHEPLFGVESSDIATLEARVGVIMQELNSSPS